jgi:hypothetical protein
MKFAPALALFIACCLSGGSASAAVITVNSSYDSVAHPAGAGGVSDSRCSLREAIANANANALTFTDCSSGSGSDIIIFAAGISSITLDDLLTISSIVTIDGTVELLGFGPDPRNAFIVTTGSLSLIGVSGEPVITPGGGSSVPEPSAALLVASALLGLALSRRGARAAASVL